MLGLKLPQLPLVPHISVGEVGQLVACPVPSHYPNLIGPLGTNSVKFKSKWKNFSFIIQNAFQSVVCEMAAILSRSRWVNPYHYREDRKVGNPIVSVSVVGSYPRSSNEFLLWVLDLDKKLLGKSYHFIQNKILGNPLVAIEVAMRI